MLGFAFRFYNLIPSLTVRADVALLTDIVSNPMNPEDALAIIDLGKRMESIASATLPTEPAGAGVA